MFNVMCCLFTIDEVNLLPMLPVFLYLCVNVCTTLKQNSAPLFANSFETQRNGLVFIYDMAGSNYTNFELDLSKKILNLLKVGKFLCF